MPDIDGTIYVTVTGGIVQEVYHSDGFKASVNVEVMDFDNDGCECEGADPHSHEVHEVRPED